MFPFSAYKSVLEKEKYEVREQRERERNEFTLSLAVYGSPAPRHFQQTNVCTDGSRAAPKKERRNQSFSFPVDEILLLTKRLELSTLRERKTESPLCLSAADFVAESCEDEERLITNYGAVPENGGRLSPRLNSPLDLSSVSEADEESEGNCNPVDETPEKKPSHEVKTCSSSHGYTARMIESSRVASTNETNSFPDYLKTDQSEHLINLYISAVDNHGDLIKYFRPCRACKKCFCICSEAYPHSRVVTLEKSQARKDKSSRQSWLSGHGEEGCSFVKINKAVETDVSVTQFCCECSGCPFLRKRCFREENECRPCRACQVHEPNLLSSMDEDACGQCCSCSCAVEEDPHGSEESGDGEDAGGVLSYASSLANAARSARVLARDLELVLSNFKIDFD